MRDGEVEPSLARVEERGPRPRGGRDARGHPPGVGVVGLYFVAKGLNGFGYALSLEAGQKVNLDNGWSTTPQLQLVYSSVDFDSFTGPNGEKVSLSDGDSLKGRAGLTLDHEASWQASNGTTSRSHLYGIGNLTYEFLDGSTVSVSGTDLKQAQDRLWGGLGLGGSYAWDNDAYTLHGEASLNTSLANFADSTSLNGTIGIDIAW